MALQIPLYSVNRKLKKKRGKRQNTGVGWEASLVRAQTTMRILRHTVATVLIFSFLIASFLFLFSSFSFFFVSRPLLFFLSSSSPIFSISSPFLFLLNLHLAEERARVFPM